MRRSHRPRQQRPSSYYQVAGLDLDREMRRLCSLPVFGGDGLARDVPQLSVRRASARPRRHLGFAVPGERRISVTAYPGIRPGDALETLLHELVHIAIGRHDRGWHGPKFGAVLREAMRQAYGITGVDTRASTHGGYAEALERRRRVPPGRHGLHPQQLALDMAA